MARTISEIIGDMGLPRGADADPFAKTEATTLDNVMKTLTELRSQNDELASAKGFARSSFTEGVQAKQEGDVLGQVFQQFAQARQTEDLAQSAFNRQLVGQGMAYDLSQDAADKDVTRSITLAKENANLRETAAQADQTRNLETLNTQANISKDLAENQTELQKELNQQTNTYQQELLKLQTTQQKELNTQQFDLGERANDANLQRSIDLGKANLDNQIATLKQQYDNEVALMEEKLKNMPTEYQYATDYIKDKLRAEYELKQEETAMNFAWSMTATGIFNTIGLLKNVPGMEWTGDMAETFTNNFNDAWKSLYPNSSSAKPSN